MVGMDDWIAFNSNPHGQSKPTRSSEELDKASANVDGKIAELRKELAKPKPGFFQVLVAAKSDDRQAGRG